MLASLAWKNLLRSKGRSLVTLLLSIVSTWFFILYVAFMQGSHSQLIRNGVELYTGYAHINARGYRDDEGYDYLIEDLDALTEALRSVPGVETVAARFETFALLSVKNATVGAMVCGIEPENEAKVSRLADALQAGEYLDGNDKNVIYIGNELAKRLEIGLGDEVALIGSDIFYSTAAELFRVKGIFRTGQFDFDANSAFVNKSYFDEVMQSTNMASYAVLGVTDSGNYMERVRQNSNIASGAFSDPEAMEPLLHSVASVLPPRLEVVGWEVLLEPLIEALMIDSVFGYISIGIFFVVIFFVVMIFGYISIGARVREIGILRALGLDRGDVFRLLFYEALILASAGLVLGVTSGALNVWYFELYPLHIEGLTEMYKEYEFSLISDEIPISFNWWTILWNALAVMALNLLSVLYPIFQINKMEPVEAMHHV